MNLVKREQDGITYYVPRRYEYAPDTGKKWSTDPEDVNAYIPSASYDKEIGKWKFSFAGADSGGYDVEIFTYYFDKVMDILDFVGFPLGAESR